MKFLVTISTKRYEVVFVVISQKTSGLNMMYLEAFQATAMLTAPSIALQYLLPKSFV